MAGKIARNIRVSSGKIVDANVVTSDGRIISLIFLLKVMVKYMISENNSALS